MGRNISQLINFDALLIRDLSRINTSKYLVSRIIKPCISFRNKYGIWLTIDYWYRIVYSKSKRNVKLDPKQISYRRRGHPSCWSSYRFYSLMGDIGSKKPSGSSWEFVWIILRFLCLKIKIQGHKDYSCSPLCLSIFFCFCNFC